ncbi:alpha/beta fold family hydrolase [Natrialba hulunbeirensis JCM 10989]|uniref:Alpha/beta fold family hydrolase n=1 Tax=Natrialba hulunbeirensis JCM 10989 TaxID=1227493 RepID=L9ZUT9_9EURY|nr:alpha/beta fold hydrolase [Natrialba hulunbeirensis]ELY90255.1 alpha/beta fold family hydrolase [Natrialba hulunbeirensis JCM 10989]
MGLAQHEVTADDGTALNLWELSADRSDAAVLFVHGALTCSRALFAPPVAGDDSYSWLHAAANDRTAFALDVRGYGDSDLPAALEEPPEANGPPVRATDAVRDIRAAVEFVSDRFETVHFVGVSWGTITGGLYLAENDPDLASATLCAPVYKPEYEFEVGMQGFGLETDLDAYFVERREEVEARQDPDNEALFEAVWNTQVESNQGLEDGEGYLAQTGALADVREGCEGNPVYDASEVDCPTLVVRGSDDQVAGRGDALALYDELSLPNDHREYAEIGGGDHFVMHGARRHTLYDLVDTYQRRHEDGAV